MKFHMVTDANYDLPLTGTVTTAKRNNSPLLPTVMEHGEALHPWLVPRVAVADRGYDAKSNHQYLIDHGVLPIIHIRKATAHNGLRDGIYESKGAPTCFGSVPMEYVTSHPEFGHMYRCQEGGCHLAGSLKGGIIHCDAEVWEDPARNPRVLGPVRRDSQEWEDLYSKRQAIERIFKSLKESRRLNSHCTRGL